MIEKLIVLEDIDPVIFYGVNNANIQLIKALYPKLRIVARGNVIKVLGDEEEMCAFEENITKLVIHQDGKVYFNTDKVCADTLCTLDWENDSQINRAYSAMLTSVTTERALTFLGLRIKWRSVLHRRKWGRFLRYWFSFDTLHSTLLTYRAM